MKKKEAKPKKTAKAKTFKLNGSFSDAIMVSAGKTPKNAISITTSGRK